MHSGNDFYTPIYLYASVKRFVCSFVYRFVNTTARVGKRGGKVGVRGNSILSEVKDRTKGFVADETRLETSLAELRNFKWPKPLCDCRGLIPPVLLGCHTL